MFTPASHHRYLLCKSEANPNPRSAALVDEEPSSNVCLALIESRCGGLNTSVCGRPTSSLLLITKSFIMSLFSSAGRIYSTHTKHPPTTDWLTPTVLIMCPIILSKMINNNVRNAHMRVSVVEAVLEPASSESSSPGSLKASHHLFWINTTKRRFNVSRESRWSEPFMCPMYETNSFNKLNGLSWSTRLSLADMSYDKC